MNLRFHAISWMCVLALSGCRTPYQGVKGREIQEQCFKCVDFAYNQCVQSGFPEEDCWKAKQALKIRCWPLE